MDEKKLVDAFKLVSEWHREQDKTCNVCHAPRGTGIIDACISSLPSDCLRAEGGLKGVTNACCGHGKDEEKYVTTITGRYFEGIGAFRQYQKWLATPEAQMALTCYLIRFGWMDRWVERGPMREFCRWCALLQCECTCCTWTYNKEGMLTVQRNR